MATLHDFSFGAGREGGDHSSDTDHGPYFNPSPEPLFTSLDDLRSEMVRRNGQGDAFIDYLVDGDLTDGKGIWVSDSLATRAALAKIVNDNPHLACESPYGSHFRQDRVRERGENRVVLKHLDDCPLDHAEQTRRYRASVKDGSARPRALFAGGPAAKIASILLQMESAKKNHLEVIFALDGAEQSNESGSASYEHINHANALNAEHDNTGLGIFMTAAKRALFGEPDPEVALKTDYHKVDLWPAGVFLCDIPIYFYNEVHGLVQRLKQYLGMPNDHDKSRNASRISTHILSHIEEQTGKKLRLPNQRPRANFLYFTPEQHRSSVLENRMLRRTVGLLPRKLSRSEIEQCYGRQTAMNICSADVFPENHCIRHGFDAVCGGILDGLGGTRLERTRVSEIVFTQPERAEAGDSLDVAGVIVQDLRTEASRFIPVSYLGLTLGPTATYDYYQSKYPAGGALRPGGGPVPHQTIATGLSCQVLFKITDPSRFVELPYTGLKQTHFVEIGRSADHILVKLTSGGVIGLPVYSRSYAISALSNMLRVMRPDSGLEFVDVVCAWPCTRAVNGPNNGQVVRLANNCAIRFGEGGTGMSKMGTNAQTLIDMVDLDTGLPANLRMNEALYRHTIIDRRKRVARRFRADSRAVR